MNDKNVTIWFEISVKDEGYSWDAMGRSKVEITVPLYFAELIDPGNIFSGTLKSAILDYEEKKAEKENEDVEDD